MKVCQIKIKDEYTYDEILGDIMDCLPSGGLDGLLKMRNSPNAFTKSPFCEVCGRHLKKIELRIEVGTKTFDFGPKCAKYGLEALKDYTTEKP